VRDRIPFVFFLLVSILVFRILRIINEPSDTAPEKKVVLYFQLITAVVPVSGVVFFFLLPLKMLELVKFCASFVTLTTLLLHVIFNSTEYRAHLSTI
jgi:hypothetical protein